MGAILALDLGTKCGWAIQQAGVVTSGSQPFNPQRFEGGGMRYLRFKRWIQEVGGGGVVEAVYFEEVRRHMGVDAAHCYGGFMAHLTAWCEAQTPKIPYQGIPVGTIKKHYTGKGNADKQAMVEAARRHGHSPADDNEADALALLDYVAQNAQAQVNEQKQEGKNVPCSALLGAHRRRNREQLSGS